MSDNPMSSSGGRAWLQGLLKDGPAVITFVKSNGEERKMRCTLAEDVVPQYEKKTEKVKTKNDDVLPVWDLDKQEWRSFRLDSIKLIEFGVS